MSFEQIGRYRVIRKLGQGGMGEVYLGYDETLEREVAIKVLPHELEMDDGRLKRFFAEARLASAVNHPNAAHIYELGESEGRHFIALEYVEGVTLSSRIGSLGVDDALRIAADVAEALAAAHAKRVIHRDVKPANVMITPEGWVKLLDFGLAKRHDHDLAIDATAPLGMTGPGVILGTLPYLSPEQALGRDLDERTDIYSFGVLLFEMLASRRPFEAPTAPQLFDRILHDEPPSLRSLNPAVPPTLVQFVVRCMAKRREDRPPSMASVASELRGMRSSPSEHTEPHPDALTAVEKTPNRSVAVLPFADLSERRDQQFFCDGIAEEISIALSKVKRLRVAAFASTSSYRDADPRELARRLSVDALLEGSLRKAGERLRVSARLTSTTDGFLLWSERYDRQLDDVFAIQEDIAIRIAGALEVTLNASEAREVERLAARDVRAYELYLRGRDLFERATRAGLEAAIEMYGRAAEIDPHYARAYAGMAVCWTHLYQWHGEDPAALAAAEEAGAKAVRLDPRLAEAHVARSLVHVLRERFDEAEEGFRQARSPDPALFDAPYFLAMLLRRMGRSEEAAALFLEANRVRPEDHRSLGLAANIYDGLGRDDEASRIRRRVVALLDDHLRLAPDDAKAMIMQGNTWIQLGDKVRGLEFLRRAAAASAGEPLLLYNIACGFSLTGDYDGALETLEKAADHGFRDVRILEQDSDFAPLRDHPRFRALVDRLRGT